MTAILKPDLSIIATQYLEREDAYKLAKQRFETSKDDMRAALERIGEPTQACGYRWSLAANCRHSYPVRPTVEGLILSGVSTDDCWGAVRIHNASLALVTKANRAAFRRVAPLRETVDYAPKVVKRELKS